MVYGLKSLSKWRLHRFYSKDSKIVKHLPPTAFMTPSTLSSFLKKYRSVYIKGTHSHTGAGIIKAWKTEDGYRFVKVRGKVMSASSTNELYRKIKAFNRKRAYIVQKAIPLAAVNGRFFDIRVMMMRDRTRKWNYAGVIAKVAGQGSVISNVLRGRGYALTIEDALRKSLRFGSGQIKQTKKKLLSLSGRIIRHSESFKKFYSFQCGIDLAVDKKGNIWIIEVNLHNPSHALFKKLSDKTYYRRIRRLYRDYRKYNKRIM